MEGSLETWPDVSKRVRAEPTKSLAPRLLGNPPFMDRSNSRTFQPIQPFWRMGSAGFLRNSRSWGDRIAPRRLVNSVYLFCTCTGAFEPIQPFWRIENPESY
jgi:hypothetical protein